VVICYFQGNGGSTPLRLPLLSQVLRTIADKSKSKSIDPSLVNNVDYTVVALSYRGYWTSSGRATQSGIELDAQAFLDWVSETYATPGTNLQVILWGHSLGSAIASSATATYLSRRSGEERSGDEGERSCPRPDIAGLILEAPSSSIKDMLISLYPQKWLPYRYLWPFSWNHWSCTTALERMALWRDQNKDQSSGTRQEDSSGPSVLPERKSKPLAPTPLRSLPPILLVSAQNDEVIPPHVADGLEADGKRLGLDIERKDVRGALHTEAPVKVDGREAMVNFIFKSTMPSKKPH
jgi:pimeloyl-ACP methyl ester carboxylesterase